MNTSIMETAGVPAIVDAVRDATKAVGSKVHDIHVPAAVHVPKNLSPKTLSKHVPVHMGKRKSRFRARNLLLLAGLGAVIAGIAMMRRRRAELPDS